MAEHMPESLFPIKEEELRRFKKKAYQFIASVSWIPQQSSKKTQEKNLLMRSIVSQVGEKRDSVSIKDVFLDFCRKNYETEILGDSINHTLNILLDSIAIGMYVANEYTKASGLARLHEKNRSQRLESANEVDFNSMKETASAILAFVSSYYLVWKLAQHRTNEVQGISVQFEGLPELSLINPVSASQCMMYYYGVYVDRTGVAKTELEFLKLTELYFEAIIDEVKMTSGSLRFLDPFLDNHYKLEGTEFVIHGFDMVHAQQISTIEFNKVSLDEIVGNSPAKHKAKRIAERLACFDIERGVNPMLEIGAFPNVTLGYGPPGTGKSMLIAATATLTQELCDKVGVPFLFWPFPDNIVSTFQGGSAERALEWFRPMQNKGRVVYAPVDDAENNLQNRTMQGVSAGVREVVGVFLRMTEGAYAVNHGNFIIQLYTNLEGQLDPAVLSRIQERAPIDGAQTVNDFIDQDFLWWQKYNEVAPGFVTMKKPKGYEFMSDQKEVKSLSQLYAKTEKDFVFRSKDVEDIYEKVKKDADPHNEHAFYGAFFKAVQEAYPQFTSRNTRNIQKAIDVRLTDFDLREEWWEKPDLFFRKDYEGKKEMLLVLMKENMKDLSFGEIRLQETLRYVDTTIQILSSEFTRKVEERREQLRINVAAQKGI